MSKQEFDRNVCGQRSAQSQFLVVKVIQQHNQRLVSFVILKLCAVASLVLPKTPKKRSTILCVL